jgi:ferredoxin--NADP+ reductase
LGSGRAGLNAAAQLLVRERPEFSVDLFERLGMPFGLVRVGVAPDHPKIKAVTGAFDRTAQHDRLRFHGWVELGLTLRAMS